MKEKIVNKITDFIIKHKNCDERKIKIIKYGLTGLYSIITKMIVIIFLVLLLNSFWEFITILISYILLRMNSFGLHSPKAWVCWLSTILIYVGGALLVKYVNFNIYLTYIIWTFSFISFILWAPADTPKRPLIRANQRKSQKIRTCIIAVIYFIVIIFCKNSIVIDALTLSLLIQSIMINPFVYWLTKTPFNNYKSYPNKV